MTIRGPYEIVHYFVGLSTDTKPTVNATLGDRFFESDTRLWYIYDGSTWSMLNEEFSLSLYGKCSSTMAASTTELVVPTLVGYGNDFFNNKFYVQILKNANSVGNAPEIQVRKITDYVSTSGTFTVDAFGANVEASDELVVLHESLVAVGRDDSDNVFSSINVGANADGSMLERLEWIQAALGSAAGQLRTVFSASDTVEENAIQFFNIGIFDIDAGAIALANINITSISAVMEKSTGGGAFSSVGITQPTFSKANGSVYCSYQFLAAEWATGDTYKLVVDDITATIHSTTGYVPTGVWSNVVVETGDIKNDVQYLYAVADGGTTSPTQIVDNSILSILMTKDSGGDVSDFDNSTDSLEAQSDKLGAFTGDGGTDQGDSVKANQDIIISEIDHLYAVADGTDVYPASAVDDSIIAKVLGKGATASASTYDNQTDSLEMLSDKLGTFSGDGGANQDDSIKASLDLVHTDLDTLISKLATGVGQVQIIQTTESLDQAAASYDLFTGTTQAVLLEGFSLKLPTGAVGGALTSVSVQTDDATPGVIISSTLGAVTNLTSEAEISWTGCLLVNVGTKIQLTIAGGAHGSAYTATFTAKYRAVTAGGTLA